MDKKLLNQDALVIVSASNQFAIDRNHEYVGTEHILYGLLSNFSIALVILRRLDPSGKIGRALVSLILEGPKMVIIGNLPLTPLAKQVYSYACTERVYQTNQNINCDTLVSSVDILIGLVRAEEGLAHRCITTSCYGDLLGLSQKHRAEAIEEIVKKIRAQSLMIGPDDLEQARIEMAATKKTNEAKTDNSISLAIIIELYLYRAGLKKKEIADLMEWVGSSIPNAKALLSLIHSFRIEKADAKLEYEKMEKILINFSEPISKAALIENSPIGEIKYIASLIFEPCKPNPKALKALKNS